MYAILYFSTQGWNYLLISNRGDCEYDSEDHRNIGYRNLTMLKRDFYNLHGNKPVITFRGET